MTLPTVSNETVYRSVSNQSIDFDHDETPGDVTEALFYIRDEIDGTVYFRLKYSDDPGQWTISADGTGSIAFLDDDLTDIKDGNYVYDIKLETASTNIAYQRGTIDIIGDV